VAALIWIVRALVLLLILRFVLRLLFGPGASAGRPQARRDSGPVERAGGELVRDPQCGTHIPKSRAIAVGSGAGTTYFCSTTCRDAFDKRPWNPGP
jgi:uncharacterized protein